MTNVRVENLHPGDRVDLLSCPYLKTDPSAEFEWAVVDAVIRETDNCVVVIYDSLDEVGYPVGTVLKVRD